MSQLLFTLQRQQQQYLIPACHQPCEPIYCAYLYPHKRRHSRWKLSQGLNRKYATFFAKYTCVEMASRKIQTYQNKANNLCTIHFVFDLDGECKFIKNIVIKEICLAATLVGWIGGDFVHRKCMDYVHVNKWSSISDIRRTNLPLP